MEVKPTIVTAFFDLNRENWENSGRTNKSIWIPLNFGLV